MIRLVTLDPIDPEVLTQLSRILFQAFGLGCEYAGDVNLPKEVLKGELVDAVALVSKAPAVKSFGHDKVVYLTTRAFAPRELPSGKAPTTGFAQYASERAVCTTHGLPSGDPEVLVKRLAKQVVHDVGHLWELHHCLDPRCSMYATWAPSFATGEPILCTFCREKSEQKIRMAKT